MSDITRKSKIARLPASIREELNLRLLNGESGSKILPWLNGLEEVAAVVTEDFEGLCINDQNLSAWRLGGYQDWLKRRDRLDHTKELASFSMKLARANGGNLSEGAAAIAGGKIMEILEQIEGAVTPEDLNNLTLAIARLRKGDQVNDTLDLNRERLKATREQLELERMKFLTNLLDASKLAKAQEITTSKVSDADKIAALRRVYFEDVDALEQSGDIKFPDKPQ